MEVGEVGIGGGAGVLGVLGGSRSNLFLYLKPLKSYQPGIGIPSVIRIIRVVGVFTGLWIHSFIRIVWVVGL